MSHLTLDEEFRSRHLRAQHSRPSGVLEGLGMGGKEVALGLYDAVSGIVRQPVREVQAGGGVVGGLKGFGKGTLGAIPKLYVGTSTGLQKVCIFGWEGEPLFSFAASRSGDHVVFLPPLILGAAGCTRVNVPPLPLQVMEGIRNSASTAPESMEAVRLPRAFHGDAWLMRPYDTNAAAALWVLDYATG